MNTNKTVFLSTKESLEKNKTSTSVVSILNDIMEKNFPVTQIITNDYYTFENNLKENIAQIDRSLVNIEHVFLVDAGGARMFDKEVRKSSSGERTEVYSFLEINKENRPNIIDGQLERLIGSPLFGIMLLKKLVETLKEDQNKKNKMVIIKDFDLLFKTRKEQLLAYHKLESYYDFLATKECKLVILNKTKIESLNQQEIEIDIIKYTHSNRAFKEELMNDTKAMTAQMSESTGVDILSDLDIETFLDLTEHLTFCELENIIKDGFESTEDLMERFETRKLKKIMEANPEIKITKPKVTLEQLIGFKNAKSFVLKGMDKKMIKSMLILGVPGTGKTLFAEALANHFDIPLIEISLTDSASKYVGESERNAKRIFEALKQIPEAIILMDEIEKQIGSAGSSHSGDSGTGTKVLGELLKFLQGRTAGKNLFYATANNIKTIQNNCPEMLRAGRMDTVMFADYPDLEDIDELVDLYSSKYGYEGKLPNSTKLVNERWTGGEVDTLFRLATMLDESTDEIIKQGHISLVSKKYKDDHKEGVMKA